MSFTVPAMPTSVVSVSERPAKPWNVLLTEVVDVLKEFHRMHFVPHHGVMESLVEMGFTEEDAEAALMVTGNKRGPAVSWKRSHIRLMNSRFMIQTLEKIGLCKHFVSITAYHRSLGFLHKMQISPVNI
jgi:hypothetical protein